MARAPLGCHHPRRPAATYQKQAFKSSPTTAMAEEIFGPPHRGVVATSDPPRCRPPLQKMGGRRKNLIGLVGHTVSHCIRMPRCIMSSMDLATLEDGLFEQCKMLACITTYALHHHVLPFGHWLIKVLSCYRRLLMSAVEQVYRSALLRLLRSCQRWYLVPGFQRQMCQPACRQGLALVYM